jgi:hypothetical protein
MGKSLGIRCRSILGNVPKSCADYSRLCRKTRAELLRLQAVCEESADEVDAIMKMLDDKDAALEEKDIRIHDLQRDLEGLRGKVARMDKLEGNFSRAVYEALGCVCVCMCVYVCVCVCVCVCLCVCVFLTWLPVPQVGGACASAGSLSRVCDSRCADRGGKRSFGGRCGNFVSHIHISQLTKQEFTYPHRP